MANYSLLQLTEGTYRDDKVWPLNLHPSISDDGSRVVYVSAIEPGRPGYSIWLYDRNNHDELEKLSVNVRGDEHFLDASYSQISGDGQKIIFASQFFYTEERKTGIYIYDINSGTIRLVVNDMIPYEAEGAGRIGRPGMRKYVNSKPSISSNGQRIAYVLTDYVYSGATQYHWRATRQRLMIADIDRENVRGGSVLEITAESAFGHGIQSLMISGDGRHIAFYAGGIIEGLNVSNLEMPAYTTERNAGSLSQTCNVYCYIVHIQRPGQYTLKVVPKPELSTQPLIVAHPYTGNIQSFNMSSVLNTPPSITADGSRIALNAEFIMGSENTGTYIYEPFGTSIGTNNIITFGIQPGVGSEETPLTTGVAPAISTDGNWLAYYRRDVRFREGYNNPDAYIEGESYCPSVEKDEVQVLHFSDGDISNLIDYNDEDCTPYTSGMALDIADNASHVAFISTADKVGRNRDLSHEVYYASKETLKYLKPIKNLSCRKIRKSKKNIL